MSFAEEYLRAHPAVARRLPDPGGKRAVAPVWDVERTPAGRMWNLAREEVPSSTTIPSTSWTPRWGHLTIKLFPGIRRSGRRSS